MLKRGQVAIFLVLGVIIVMSVLIAVVLSAQQTKPIENIARDTQSRDTTEITNYVKSCLAQSTSAVTYALAAQGILDSEQEGSLSIWSSPKEQQITTLQRTELKIKEQIEPKVALCIQELPDLYGNQEILARTINVTVRVSQDSVDTYMQLPLVVKDDTQQSLVEDISVTVPLRIGLLVTLGNAAINKIISGNQIDFDKYSIYKDPSITIYSDREFEQSTITISDASVNPPLELNFLFEQGNLFANTNIQKQGCCSLDNQCRTDVGQTYCEELGGLFSTDQACSCPDPLHIEEQNALQCDGKPCRSCGPIKHGQSWCVADTGVGGRFYDFSCVDGNTIAQPCADYKLEVCAQTTSGTQTLAACRPNAAPSCSACKDENCCNQLNDCVYKQNSCLPKVPIGTPFWTEIGFELCKNVPKRPCIGCTSQEESSFELQQCQAYGDCGANLNIYGDISLGQFLGSQAITEEDVIRVYETQQEYIQSLSAIDNANQVLIAEEGSAANLVQSYLNSIGNIADVQSTVAKQNQILSCQAYVPPTQGACTICNNRGVPCTEYACRSLGQDCVFEVINQTGTCQSAEYTQGQVKIVSIQANFSLEEDADGLIASSVINLPINEEITVKTNYESRCAVSAFKDPNTLPFIRYTDTFNTTNVVKVTVPKDIFSIEKLRIALDKQDYLQTAQHILEIFSDTYAQDITDFNDALLVARLLPIVSYFEDPKYQSAIEQQVALLQNNIVTTYIHCKDRQGFADPVRILLPYSPSCDTEFAINNIEHKPQSLMVITTAPASCSYSSNSTNSKRMQCDSTLDFEKNGFVCTSNSSVIAQNIDINCSTINHNERQNTYTLVVNDTGISETTYSSNQNDILTINTGADFTIRSNDNLYCESQTEQITCQKDTCTVQQPITNNSQIVCANLENSFLCQSNNIGVQTINTNSTAQNVTSSIEAKYNILRGSVQFENLEKFAFCNIELNNKLYIAVKDEIFVDLPSGIHVAIVSCADGNAQTKKQIPISVEGNLFN